MTSNTPVTELDPRFSDPSAAPTSWTSTTEILRGAEISWLTTVTADGRPHVTPLVAVWLDDAAHFATGPSEQKAINLEHNPDVALTTGCNRWDEGTDVVVLGTAERITDVVLLTRLADAWRTRWDGESWEYTVAADGFVHQGHRAHVFRVRPDKVFAFGKGDVFSHTRHRWR